MKEEWRDIPGFENYQASSLGRIRSLDRYITCEHAGYSRTVLTKGCVLRTAVGNKIGYLYVIPCINKVRVTARVHHLVALAFKGPRPSGLHVAHDDGNHLNNRPSNLIYKTVAANRHDSVKHGRYSLLSVDVKSIRKAIAKGERNVAIAKRYNVQPQLISHIKNKRAYAAVY
jgi:hypothetical protein